LWHHRRRSVPFHHRAWDGAEAGRLADRAVAQVVQRRARDADLVPGLSRGHSLRAGFATQGFTHGLPEFRIMQDGRWKSSSSMRGYIREGELFRDSTSSKLVL
jgi:hypothetical protein